MAGQDTDQGTLQDQEVADCRRLWSKSDSHDTANHWDWVVDMVKECVRGGELFVPGDDNDQRD